MSELLPYLAPLTTLVVVTGAIYTLKADSRNTRKALEEHAAASRAGFQGVNERLDKLNGKVYDHEGRLGKAEAKLEG